MKIKAQVPCDGTGRKAPSKNEFAKIKPMEYGVDGENQKFL